MAKPIIQIQLINEDTGEVVETVVPESEARAILYMDGTTEVDLQTYLENLVLSVGEKGDKGDPGPKGDDGAPGEKGADGSKLHNVTTAPTTGLGAIGDWALNTSNGDVYEKTATSTWTSRGNFKGPKGDQGVKGDRGDKGAKGDKGDKGDSGDSVRYGVDYATGQDVKMFFKKV